MPAIIRSSKCQVVAQAILAGVQTIRVRVFWRHDGWVAPYISVRIGRVLLNIEDHEALLSLLDAAHQAEQAAERAFGPRERQAG